MNRIELLADIAPLASSGGKQFQPIGRDDFCDFIELMEVIEALCPVLPPRPILVGNDFRL